MIFQASMIMFHVNLPGCRSNFRTVALTTQIPMDFHQFDVDWRSLRRCCCSLACRKGEKRRVRNKTQFRPWISIWTSMINIYIYIHGEWSSFLFSLFFVFFITLWKLHRVFRNFLTFSCLARLRFKGFFHQWWRGNCRSWLSQLMASHMMSRCQDVPNKNQGQIQDLREVGCGLGDLGLYEVCGFESFKWHEMNRTN